MNQTEIDPFAEAHSHASASPCGCKGKQASRVSSTPTLAELDAVLQAATATTAASGDLPDLVELEAALRTFEDGTLEGERQASLDELVAFARRHPGLRVTLSF